MYIKIARKITLLLTIVILVGFGVSSIEGIVLNKGAQVSGDNTSKDNETSSLNNALENTTPGDNNPENITSSDETSLENITSGNNDSAQSTSSSTGNNMESETTTNNDNNDNNNEMSNIDYVFVYGTLMKGMRNHAYLRTSTYIGDGQIDGYEMYDLGTYPGIIAGVGTVLGEVYEVTLETEKRLDRLENEGVLYIKKLVEVRLDDGETIVAKVYIYNRSVAGKVKMEGKYNPIKPTTAPTTKPTTESTTVEETTTEATKEQGEPTTEAPTAAEATTTEAVTAEAVTTAPPTEDSTTGFTI